MNLLKFFLAVNTVVFFSLNSANAQFKHAGEYMDALNDDQLKITEQYLIYASSIAHDKSARKVEKTRKELIKSVESATKKATKIGPYNGDKSLSDAVVNYLEIFYHILLDDYEKLVDMEEIAEQSYDAMEAYILAQELVGKKMSDASDNMNVVYLAFAATNNVTIIDRQTQLGLKMKKVEEVNAYYNKVYLIFYRSFNQNNYLQKAIDESDINGIEQNKNTLAKYSAEGIQKMSELNSYKNDKSLIDASKKLLQFYIKKCEKNIPVVVDYLMEKEKFDEIKKAFDSKSNRSKEDIDKYNLAVNSMNQANNLYNQTVQEMNQSVQLTENWNTAMKNYFNKYIPRSK